MCFVELTWLIKTKRIEAGLMQKDLAKKMGYTSPQFISNWERGISKPPLKSVLKLCKILKINKTILECILLRDSANEIRKAFK